MICVLRGLVQKVLETVELRNEGHTSPFANYPTSRPIRHFCWWLESPVKPLWVEIFTTADEIGVIRRAICHSPSER